MAGHSIRSEGIWQYIQASHTVPAQPCDPASEGSHPCPTAPMTVRPMPAGQMPARLAFSSPECTPWTTAAVSPARSTSAWSRGASPGSAGASPGPGPAAAGRPRALAAARHLRLPPARRPGQLRPAGADAHADLPAGAPDRAHAAPHAGRGRHLRARRRDRRRRHPGRGRVRPGARSRTPGVGGRAGDHGRPRRRLPGRPRDRVPGGLHAAGLPRAAALPGRRAGRVPHRGPPAGAGRGRLDQGPGHRRRAVGRRR